jgi:hypothetical protein
MCQDGLKKALANMFGPAAADYPQDIRLYTNNHTPTVDDVAADYTELAAGWYAPFALSGWTPAIYVAPHAITSPTPASWTNSDAPGADVVVYGYFVLDSNGDLVWAERDPLAPVTIFGGGYTYDVAAVRQLKNE